MNLKLAICRSNYGFTYYGHWSVMDHVAYGHIGMWIVYDSLGDFTFWISLSLSKRLSETVNLSPKIRSKTEVWIRFQLRLSLSEKIISRL